MASCDNTVLTGQEGLIQFKPLGTTNCVDDFCPFVGDRIYLPCNSDYDIGDCLEVEVVKIPAGKGQAPAGGSVIVDGNKFWVVDEGKGLTDDKDACDNSMEGVPYIKVATAENGTPITWDGSLAGEEMMSGLMTGENIPVTVQGDGYNSGAPGTVTEVEIISAGGGNGAEVTLTVGALGAITSFSVTKPGSGYQAGDVIMFEAENGVGADASYTLTADDLTDVRVDSSSGNYIFRLCEFQTVCGVRDFSIDLSRDELDVTTLPCSISEACGKELASFRKTQAGFANATGTLTVYFTCDQESIQNKILQGSLQRTQGGASVRLFVCTKTDAAGNIDEDASLFIEADIQLLGLSFSVNPDDPTSAEINFGVTDVKSAFGLT
jgi:hypothetical protein